MFGMGTALTFGSDVPASGGAFFLFALMALTVSIAVLAPISALWEARIKRKNYGLRVLAGGIGGVLAGLIVLFLIE
jgi:hypothetical protein